MSARSISGIELGAVGLALEIEGETLLAAIEQGKGRALAVDKRRKMPRILAARPLDLEHLGAGFRQHQARQRPRQQRGEIQNEKARERLHVFHLNNNGGSVPVFTIHITLVSVTTDTSVPISTALDACSTQTSYCRANTNTLSAGGSAAISTAV